MTQYKGLYIDHVIFHNAADIDAFLKEKAVESYKRAVRHFAECASYEASAYCDEKAEILHRVYGLDWAEIEEIEIEAYTAA